MKRFFPIALTLLAPIKSIAQETACVAVGAFLACTTITPLEAQTVQQSGTITPGQAVRWVTNGVIGSGGTTSNPLLTGLGVLNNGGPGVCVQSAASTAAGYNRFCLSTTTNGGSKISSYAYGTATQAGITFDINGSVQGFPAVQLPVANNDATCFADSSGTVKSCGFVPLTETLTSAHIFVGNASNVATDRAVTGDASITNTAAWTNLKVNGVAYPASPATNTVPVVTSANTVTYQAAPAAALALTDGKVYIGAGTNLAAEQTIGGDASVTNAGAWTNLKVNAVSYPASPAIGTVPNVTATNTVGYSATPTLGIDGTTTGQLKLANGGASGQTVTIQNLAATAAYNFNIPATAGTAGQPLVSGAGGSTSSSWGSLRGTGPFLLGTATPYTTSVSDYATVQLALDAGASGTSASVVLPNGTTSQGKLIWPVNNQTKLSGTGTQATIYASTNTDSSASVLVGPSLTDSYIPFISDIQFQGGATSGHGINFVGPQVGPVLDNVWARGYTGAGKAGFNFQDTFISYGRNLGSFGNTFGGKFVGSKGIDWVGNWFTDNTVGIYLDPNSNGNRLAFSEIGLSSLNTAKSAIEVEGYSNHISVLFLENFTKPCSTLFSATSYGNRLDAIFADNLSICDSGVGNQLPAMPGMPFYSVNGGYNFFGPNLGGSGQLQNIFPNSSWESGAARFTASGATPPSISVSTAAAYLGTHSLALDWGTTALSGGSFDNALSLSAGVPATIMFKVLGSRTLASDEQLQITIRDGLGVGAAVYFLPQISTTQWRDFTFTFAPVASDTYTMYLSLVGSASHAALITYIDDMGQSVGQRLATYLYNGTGSTRTIIKKGLYSPLFTAYNLDIDIGGAVFFETSTATVSMQVDPSTATYSFYLPTGAGTAGDCLKSGGAGAAWAFSTCNSGITIGTTTISGGTTGRVLYDNAGAFGEYAISGTGNVAMTTSPVFTTPNLGTPSALTLTNATGLPIAGITGLGTGVGTWLATPSSANLAAAMTDETGTGALVFGTAPTFTTSLTSTLVIGGAAAGSSLTLESTSGAGTTDFINFKVASQAEVARFTTDKKYLQGATVSYDQGGTSGGGLTPFWQLYGDGTAGAMAVLRYNTTATSGAAVQLTTSRGATVGTYSAVQSGDGLGALSFSGDNGTNYLGTGARILAIAEGTFAVGSTPAKLSFRTTQSGADSPTERMSIVGSGGIFMPSLTTSASTQTSALCRNASNELIAASVNCISSAARFKQDIRVLPLADALAKVMALAPVSFMYRPEFNGARQNDPNYGGEQIGFIAEQVATVDPRLAIYDLDGTIRGVKYEQSTALLTAAIQSLSADNDNLRRRMEALERKIR